MAPDSETYLPEFGDYDVSFDVPNTGTRWHVRFNDDGSVDTVMSQNCTQILDLNQKLASETGITKDKSMFRVASVPLVLLEDWKNLGIDHRDQEGAKKIMSMLGSSDYRGLRTSKERL
jgi:hypothetical protein